VLPTLSVARKVCELNSENKVLYVGSLKATDRKLVRNAGYNFIGIPTGKWRRYFDLRNILDIFTVFIGFVVALFIVIFYWPNKVFIKGGYVGLPVGLAAWILRRPIVLHESDAVMGVANKMLMRFADKICVSFPVDLYKLPHNLKSKMVYTGVPVNDVFYTKELGDTNVFLDLAKPLILVIGGSLGARPINLIIKKITPKLLEKYQIVHLSGKLDYSMLKQWSNSLDIDTYHLFDFLPSTQVASFMKKSDLIISRAGATAIAEIAAVAKPSILIPLKGSANNHQYCNALYLNNQEASVMINQDDLNSELLLSNIDKIIQSDLNKRLSFNIATFAKTDAASQITNLLLNI